MIVTPSTAVAVPGVTFCGTGLPGHCHRRARGRRDGEPAAAQTGHDDGRADDHLGLTGELHIDYLPSWIAAPIGTIGPANQHAHIVNRGHMPYIVDTPPGRFSSTLTEGTHHWAATHPGRAARPEASSRRSGGRLQSVWPAVRLRSGLRRSRTPRRTDPRSGARSTVPGYSALGFCSCQSAMAGRFAMKLFLMSSVSTW